MTISIQITIRMTHSVAGQVKSVNLVVEGFGYASEARAAVSQLFDEMIERVEQRNKESDADGQED